ncbi:MAG: hypothetical protein OXC72_15155, partial [Roseovarius sp.]|nr:hypothetical protein [Roseovarius sp.]
AFFFCNSNNDVSTIDVVQVIGVGANCFYYLRANRFGIPGGLEFNASVAEEIVQICWKICAHRKRPDFGNPDFMKHIISSITTHFQKFSLTDLFAF